MKIHKHKSSHKESERKNLSSHLFSLSRRDLQSPRKDGYGCGDVHIGVHQLPSPGSIGLVGDPSCSFERSILPMSDGKMKSPCSLEKMNRMSTVCDSPSPGSKVKSNTKGGEEVDASYQMLIEQYQQSNALLAQNINTLLYLNQQAASGGKGSSSTTITVTSNTVSKLNSSLTSTLSKQVLNQVKNQITSAYKSTSPSASCDTNSKQLNGIGSPISSAKKLIFSSEKVTISHGESASTSLFNRKHKNRVRNRSRSGRGIVTTKGNCLPATKTIYTSVTEKKVNKQYDSKEMKGISSVIERRSNKPSASKDMQVMTTTAFPLSLSMPKSYMAKLQNHKGDKGHNRYSSLKSQPFPSENRNTKKSSRRLHIGINQDKRKTNSSAKSSRKVEKYHARLEQVSKLELDETKHVTSVTKEHSPNLGAMTECLKIQKKKPTTQHRSQIYDELIGYTSTVSECVKTTATTTIANDSTPVSPAAASIVKKVLDGKSLQTLSRSYTSDPRLSLERISRKRSMSASFSDSGDSFTCSHLEESNVESSIKYSKLSAKCDEGVMQVNSPISYLKSNKTYGNPEAHKLTFLEYQQRRREGCKATPTSKEAGSPSYVTNPSLATEDTLNSDAVHDTNSRSLESSNSEVKEKEDKMDKNQNENLEYVEKGGEVDCTGKDAEEGEPEVDKYAKKNAALGALSDLDEDFFIPRKLNFSAVDDVNCTLENLDADKDCKQAENGTLNVVIDHEESSYTESVPQEVCMMDDTKKWSLHQPLSESGVMDVSKCASGNTISNSTAKQGRRLGNGNSGENLKYLHGSSVRIDDDIEYEYQTFLKNIGVNRLGGGRGGKPNNKKISHLDESGNDSQLEMNRGLKSNVDLKIDDEILISLSGKKGMHLSDDNLVSDLIGPCANVHAICPKKDGEGSQISIKTGPEDNIREKASCLPTSATEEHGVYVVQKTDGGNGTLVSQSSPNKPEQPDSQVVTEPSIAVAPANIQGSCLTLMVKEDLDSNNIKLPAGVKGTIENQSKLQCPGNHVSEKRRRRNRPPLEKKEPRSSFGVPLKKGTVHSMKNTKVTKTQLDDGGITNILKVMEGSISNSSAVSDTPLRKSYDINFQDSEETGYATFTKQVESNTNNTENLTSEKTTMSATLKKTAKTIVSTKKKKHSASKLKNRIRNDVASKKTVKTEEAILNKTKEIVDATGIIDEKTSSTLKGRGITGDTTMKKTKTIVDVPLKNGNAASSDKAKKNKKAILKRIKTNKNVITKNRKTKDATKEGKAVMPEDVKDPNDRTLDLKVINDATMKGIESCNAFSADIEEIPCDTFKTNRDIICTTSNHARGGRNPTLNDIKETNDPTLKPKETVGTKETNVATLNVLKETNVATLSGSEDANDTINNAEETTNAIFTVAKERNDATFSNKRIIDHETLNKMEEAAEAVIAVNERKKPDDSIFEVTKETTDTCWGIEETRDSISLVLNETTYSTLHAIENTDATLNDSKKKDARDTIDALNGQKKIKNSAFSDENTDGAFSDEKETDDPTLNNEIKSEVMENNVTIRNLTSKASNAILEVADDSKDVDSISIKEITDSSFCETKEINAATLSITEEANNATLNSIKEISCASSNTAKKVSDATLYGSEKANDPALKGGSKIIDEIQSVAEETENSAFNYAKESSKYLDASKETDNEIPFVAIETSGVILRFEKDGDDSTFEDIEKVSASTLAITDETNPLTLNNTKRLSEATLNDTEKVNDTTLNVSAEKKDSNYNCVKESNDASWNDRDKSNDMTSEFTEEIVDASLKVTNEENNGTLAQEENDATLEITNEMNCATWEITNETNCATLLFRKETKNDATVKDRREVYDDIQTNDTTMNDAIEIDGFTLNSAEDPNVTWNNTVETNHVISNGREGISVTLKDEPTQEVNDTKEIDDTVLAKTAESDDASMRKIRVKTDDTLLGGKEIINPSGGSSGINAPSETTGALGSQNDQSKEIFDAMEKTKDGVQDVHDEVHVILNCQVYDATLEDTKDMNSNEVTSEDQELKGLFDEGVKQESNIVDAENIEEKLKGLAEDKSDDSYPPLRDMQLYVDALCTMSTQENKQCITDTNYVNGAVDSISVRSGEAIDSVNLVRKDTDTVSSDDSSTTVFSTTDKPKGGAPDEGISKIASIFQARDVVKKSDHLVHVSRNEGIAGAEVRGVEDMDKESVMPNSLTSDDCNASTEPDSNIGDDQNLKSTIMTLLGMSNGSAHFDTNPFKNSGEAGCLEVHSGAVHQESIDRYNQSPCAHQNKNEETDGKSAFESACALVSEAKGEAGHTTMSQSELESCAISIIHENMLRLQENITINQVANVLASLDSSKNATTHTDPDSSLSFPTNLSMLEQLASVAMSESQASDLSNVTSEEGKIRLECVSPVAQSFLKDLPFVLPSPVAACRSSQSFDIEDSVDFVNSTPKISKRRVRCTRQKQRKCIKSVPTIDNDEFSDESADTTLELVNESTKEEENKDKVTISEMAVKTELKQKRVRNKKQETDQAKTRGLHSCEACGKRFTLARLLTSHMKRDHCSENETTMEVEKPMNSVAPVALESEMRKIAVCVDGAEATLEGSTDNIDDDNPDVASKRSVRRNKSSMKYRSLSAKVHEGMLASNDSSSDRKEITITTRLDSQGSLLASSIAADEKRGETQNMEESDAEPVSGSRTDQVTNNCQLSEKNAGDLVVSTRQRSKLAPVTPIKETDATTSDIGHAKKRTSHLAKPFQGTGESVLENSQTGKHNVTDQIMKTRRRSQLPALIKGEGGKIPDINFATGQSATDQMLPARRHCQSVALPKRTELSSHDTVQAEVHKATDHMMTVRSQSQLALVKGTGEVTSEVGKAEQENIADQMTTTRDSQSLTPSEGPGGSIPNLNLGEEVSCTNVRMTTRRLSQLAASVRGPGELSTCIDNNAEEQGLADQMVTANSFPELATPVKDGGEAPVDRTDEQFATDQMKTTRRHSRLSTSIRNDDEEILDIKKTDKLCGTDTVMATEKCSFLEVKEGESIPDIDLADGRHERDQSVSTRSHSELDIPSERPGEIIAANLTEIKNVAKQIVPIRRRPQLATPVKNADEIVPGINIDDNQGIDRMVTTRSQRHLAAALREVGETTDIVNQAEDRGTVGQIVTTRRRSLLAKTKRGGGEMDPNIALAEEQTVTNQMVTREHSLLTAKIKVGKEVTPGIYDVAKELGHTDGLVKTDKTISVLNQSDKPATTDQIVTSRRRSQLSLAMHSKRPDNETPDIVAEEGQVTDEVMTTRCRFQPLFVSTEEVTVNVPQVEGQAGTDQIMTTRRRSQSLKPLVTKGIADVSRTESSATNQILEKKGSAQSMLPHAISGPNKLTSNIRQAVEGNRTGHLMTSRGRSRSILGKQIKEVVKETLDDSETDARRYVDKTNATRRRSQSLIVLPNKGIKDALADSCQAEEMYTSGQIKTKNEPNTEQLIRRRVGNVDKDKEELEENSERIADSIRTKIQKLLSCSETNSDSMVDPNDPNAQSYSIFSTPEAIGKRQPKATLKKKAFMEELQTLKSRRKRIKIPSMPPSHNNGIEMNQSIKAKDTPAEEGVDSANWGTNESKTDGNEMSGIHSESRKCNSDVLQSVSKKDTHSEKELSSDLGLPTQQMSNIESSKPSEPVNPLQIPSSTSEDEILTNEGGDQKTDVQVSEKQPTIKLENNPRSLGKFVPCEQEKLVEMADKKNQEKVNKPQVTNNKTRANKTDIAESKTKGNKVLAHKRKQSVKKKCETTDTQTKMKDAVPDVDLVACEVRTCTAEINDTEKKEVKGQLPNGVSDGQSHKISNAGIVPSTSPPLVIDKEIAVKEMANDFALDTIVKTVITSPPVPRKYKCKICSSEFLKEQELSKHNSKHSTQRTYDCYKCSEKLTTMRALTKHLLVHDELASSTSTSRSHDCETCGYQCETENQLIVHKKVHEVRHFEHACALCSMKYHHLTELYAHISKFHPEDMLEILRCSHCKESVSNFEAFRKHLTVVHGMNAKQAAVACKNKGVLPEEYRKAEEEKQEILKERKRIMEEKKQALVAKKNAKGVLLRSGLLKVDKKRSIEKPAKSMKLAAKPIKTGVIRKAKAAVWRSRKMKMNLRRDAKLAPLGSSNSDAKSISEMFLSIGKSATEICDKISDEKHKVLKTECSEVGPAVPSIDTFVEPGIMQKSSLISMHKKKSDVSSTTECVVLNTHPGQKSVKVAAEANTPCQVELYEQKTESHTDQCNRNITEEESILHTAEKNPSRSSEQNAHCSSVPIIDPDPKLVRKAEVYLRHISKFHKQSDTLLPIDVLENIYQRLHVVLSESDSKNSDVGRDRSELHTIKGKMKVSSKSNLKKDVRSISKGAMKAQSRQNSKEVLTSPKYSIIQKEDGYEEALQLTWKDELKLNIKSPSYCGSMDELPEVNPLPSPGTSRRLAEEAEEQKQIRLKFESAERMARMLVRNQRRTNDGSTCQRKSRKTEKLDMTGEPIRDASPSSMVGKIEPIKVKVRVTVNELDSETTASVMTSSSLPSSAMSSLCPSDTNEMETSKKSKRKSKRKSSRGGSRKNSPDGHKSQKRRKSRKEATSHELTTECSVSKDMNGPDNNRPSSESQPGESETESFFLLPGGIDFDKEYDYKNQTKEKTLTEDDLMSSLMTLADCAVDAHMMNDSQNEATDSDEVKDQDTDIPTTVLEKVQELIDLVCQQAYFEFDDCVEATLGDHSDYDEISGCLNEKRGCCFTPNPTLDHDYFGNFDEDVYNNLSTCSTKRRRVYSETSACVNATMRRHGISSVCGSEHFLVDKDLCNLNAPKQLNMECSDLGFDKRLLRVSTKPDNEGKQQGGIVSKKLKLKDSRCDKSAVDFLSESVDSVPLKDSESDKLKVIAADDCAVENEYYEVDWKLLRCSSGSDEYNCSNTIIKTEDDVFDIDVQANDVNDIIEFKEPFEEINNNKDEAGGGASLINTDSCKVHSCQNAVDNQDVDSTCLRVNNSEITLPMVSKTVSDLIGHANGTYYCKYCRKKFRKETSVKQHSLTHLNSLKHPFKCLYCSSSFSKCSDYMRHKVVHFPGTTIEEPSGNSCHSTRLRSLHDNQEDEKNCLYCPMKFDDMKAYMLHLRKYHKMCKNVSSKCRSTKNACSKCNFVCMNRKTLLRHDKFVHGQQSDNNTCSICGRTFLKPLYLKSHIRTHQGIYPFRCSHCNEAFQLKYQLYRHLKRHKIKLKET